MKDNSQKIRKWPLSIKKKFKTFIIKEIQIKTEIPFLTYKIRKKKLDNTFC